jgi:hypothetical protein
VCATRAGSTACTLRAFAEKRANQGGVSQFRRAKTKQITEENPNRIRAMAFDRWKFLNSCRAAN